MCDSSFRLQQVTPCRGLPVDENALHTLGFRDCALEAIHFLTERARLDPDSDVVQGIRCLLDRANDTTRLPRVAAGTPTDIDISSDARSVRRARRTTRVFEDRNNRRSTARRCLYGRVSRRQSQRSRYRSRCQHASTATLSERLLFSPSVPDCEVATNRNRPSMAAADNDSRRYYPLRTLQTAATWSSSTSTATGDVQLRQDIDSTTASDVAECASLLIYLARCDARVHNVLGELLQLMDTE